MEVSVSSALASLETIWSLADSLFLHDVTAANALSRPISLRNTFVFYVGHLPAFSWNTLRPLLHAPPQHPEFDALFARGMDPDVEDPSMCHPHPPAPPAWPSWQVVLSYQARVRAAIRAAVRAAAQLPKHNQPPAPLARTLALVAEHDAMHVETLYYMLAQQRRPSARCCEPRAVSSSPVAVAAAAAPPPPPPDWIPVPAASAVPLGAPRAQHFSWDNEQNPAVIDVAPFRIARHAVSVADFLCFVRAHGYHREHLWAPDDWKWVRRESMSHPASWACAGDAAAEHEFQVLTDLGPRVGDADPQRKQRSFEETLQLPVSVSLAEARAYAAWVGAALPSEAQWLLAAYGKEGAAKEEGKVDVMTGKPHAVSEGRVAHCGAVGLVGNGWELTTTVLEEFDGFKPTPEYPEYTADFFDGKHFVLKGASWASHPLFVRPSFRNFYQARYQYVFSKFRLVASG